MKIEDLSRKLISNEDFTFRISKDSDDGKLRGIMRKGVSQAKFVMTFDEESRLLTYLELSHESLNAAQQLFLSRASNDLHLENSGGCWFLVAVGDCSNPVRLMKQAFSQLMGLDECLRLLQHPLAARNYLGI